MPHVRLGEGVARRPGAKEERQSFALHHGQREAIALAQKTRHQRCGVDLLADDEEAGDDCRRGALGEGDAGCGEGGGGTRAVAQEGLVARGLGAAAQVLLGVGKVEGSHALLISILTRSGEHHWMRAGKD